MSARTRLFDVTLLSIALLIMFALPLLAAPPSLFYSLLPLKHSQATCMKRAFATVASEVSGKIDRRADNVSLVNDDFNIGVHAGTRARTRALRPLLSHTGRASTKPGASR
jgi:hypothetical protein